MIVEAYIPGAKIEAAIRALQTLPTLIRPNFFSADEISRKTKATITDEPKFKAFVAKNEHGFFLFGERARYNIGLRPKNGFSYIAVDDFKGELSESDAVAILKVLASAGSAFAFAASLDEYHHRNRYVRTLGANQFEAWIGRDLRKYIPGIYWLTVLPKEHANTLATLSNIVGAMVTEIDAQHVLVRAFEYPSEWQQHAARIDEWLAKQPSFFSKQRILHRLDASAHIAALSEVAGECR
jgi:hypothetical protein